MTDRLEKFVERYGVTNPRVIDFIGRVMGDMDIMDKNYTDAGSIPEPNLKIDYTQQPPKVTLLRNWSLKDNYDDVVKQLKIHFSDNQVEEILESIRKEEEETAVEENKKKGFFDAMRTEPD